MTPADARLDPDRCLTDDASLEEVLGLLLREAINPRQMWFMFLDADSRLTGPLMPCDDHPRDPDEMTQTDDLGRLSFAQVLAHRLGGMLDLLDAACVAFVWERRGGAAFRSDELTWSRSMAEACAGVGVPVRAQFCLHDRGIRVLTPDDYGA